MSSSKSKRPEIGGNDIKKQKCMCIVVGGVHHEKTIKYIVASHIIARAQSETK